MDFITPWLAIGALSEASDTGLRRQHGIEAVLSLLAVDFDAGANHLTLAVADRIALPGAAIGRATAFIEQQRLAGRKTLLHCQMGISRSPAIAACYLHEFTGLQLAESVRQVGRLRPVADPHPALLDSMATHYATTLKGAHPPCLDLSANENPLGPAPLALAALQAILPKAHRYPDRHGATLRRKLARRLGGSPEQVVLGNGSCELLDLAARAFLAPGDAAIIAPPCFPAYRSAVKRAHGRLIEVAMSASDDFACRLDAITAAIDHRTRLIFLGNPNNPTGQGLAAEALADWLDTLPRQVTVVLDEAYRDYNDSNDGDDSDDEQTAADDAPDPSKTLADGPALVRAGHRLLVLRSFSKLHGLAGLRIGYAFGPADLIAPLEALRPPYNTSAAAQVAALAALNDHAHQRASRLLAANGHAQLRRGLRALGLRCPPSHGNFVLIHVDLPGIDAPQLAAKLGAAGILVKPGSAFGLPGHLRISLGLPDENQRLLDQLERITSAARHSEHMATRQGS